MQKLSMAFALLGFAAAVAAQNPNCNGAPPAQSLQTRDPFAINFYFGSGTSSVNMFFDANVQTPVTINSLDTFTYDQGVGNPVVPSQIGNTATVNIWTCPITRVGNELLVPDPNAATPSPWILMGSGTITVTAYPATSPVVFTTPVAMPSGTYGVCIEIEAPQGSQPNPVFGLHTLIGNQTNPPYVAQDSFITLTNQGVQNTGWRDVAGAWITPSAALNTYDTCVRLNYTPDPQAALFTTLGEGCYFRARGFYENHPGAAGTYDLANSGIQMIPLGANYLVVSQPSTPIALPSSTALTATPAASGSSGWDDGLSAPITLPFTFPFPNGSTNTITVSGNGFVYLASFASTDYGFVGAPYGSLLGWKDGPPRIAGFYSDMDADPATGAGGIYYDVDPSGLSATVTFYDVPEWPLATTVGRNTFSITLHATGQVDINYNSLATHVATNNALIGFSEGNANRLPNPQDLSGTMPFQSGDGAIPPILGMSARPVLGTNPKFVTTNITSGTFAQILILGLSGLNTPVDLSIYGMPGCNQYINPFSSMANFLTPNNTFEQTIVIPANPAFINLQYFVQAAPLTAGLNSAGILTSNGLCAKIGL